MSGNNVKITIKDVAKKAGVSTALVSLVINAKRLQNGSLDCPVKKETAERVLSVVRELNYRPNKAASALRSGERRTIGVICPNMAGQFFADINRHIENVAYNNGYTVLFCSSDDNPVRFGDMMNMLIADGVDALLVTPCMDAQVHIQRALDLGLPVVLMCRDLADLKGVGRVLLDNPKAVRMGLHHLFDRGFRRIEMISAPWGISTLTLREQSYMLCMSEMGLGPYARISRVNPVNMQESMESLIADAVGRNVEAILHPGASLGPISFKALKKMGLHIPQDIALIGFDGGEGYGLLDPSITQMQQSREQTAVESFKMLVNMIHGGSPETILMEPIFTEGGSTACVYHHRISENKAIGDISRVNLRNSVLCTAGSFSNLGGWTLDQQFIEVMGSSYLLSHGLGREIEDASTMIKIPTDGTYSIFARTRNWTAPFSKARTPGVFKIFIDGVPLQQILGNGSSLWHWQSAGSVRLTAGIHKIALHDLYGFDSRCSEILLTLADYAPSDSMATLLTLRRKLLSLPSAPKDKGHFNLVVAGGGVAGMCAAISAARNGLKVALIQDRSVLGGNNSSEVRVGLGGRLNIGKYPSLGYLLNEFGPSRKGNAREADVYEDERKMQAVKAEKNITFFPMYRVTGVVMSDGTERSVFDFIDGKTFPGAVNDGHIASVIATSVLTYKEISISGDLFSDCTGDASLGVISGAQWAMGRESESTYGEPSAPALADGLTLGSSIQWYCEDEPSAVDFPDIDWGLPIDETTVQKVRRGQWYWEVGMKDDQIADAERIRDYGMYVAYSNWSFIKNHSSFKDEYRNSSLKWLCSVIGKRESRRLLGDHVLTENDLLKFIQYPDGCVSTSWYIDNHEPDPQNAAKFSDPWLSRGCLRPLGFYPIPYRCLYSRNIENLFMAGRNISVSHLSLGTTRVMRTCAMLGEVVGLAATVCVRNSRSGLPLLPREIWPKHWDSLDMLMKKGAGRTDVPYQQVYTLVDTTGERSEDC